MVSARLSAGIVRLLLAAILASVIVSVGASPAAAGYVNVGASGHLVVHSAEVNEAETSFTYDLEYFVEGFESGSSLKYVVYRGDGSVLHKGGVNVGGSIRISGTTGIAGSWRKTPEEMTQFRLKLYRSVGYPATIYEWTTTLDTGWRSPSAHGSYALRDVLVDDGKLFYAIDAFIESPGGSADETCGYLPPYAKCWAQVSVKNADGDVVATRRAQYAGAVMELTNFGTSGIAVPSGTDGYSIGVDIVGTTSGAPARVLPLEPVPVPTPGGLTLVSIPGEVKRNTEAVTLVASLNGELPVLTGEQTPGLTIIDATNGTVVAVCEGERVCSALLDFVPEEQHVYVAYVADVSEGGELEPLVEVYSAPLVLPNVDGPSDYELQGGYIPSQDCAQASYADPVNTATGEFYERNLDLGVACVGPPVVFSRTYSVAAAGEDRGLGFGWSHNYDMALEPVGAEVLAESSVIDVRQENGSRVRFYGTPQAGYVPEARVRAELSRDDDGLWTYIRDGAMFEFTAEGTLQSLVDSNGNRVDFIYSSGALARVEDDFGRWLELTWDGGHVQSVRDHAERVVSYEFDGAGDLVTVTDYDELTKQYAYDSLHRVVQIVDPAGIATDNVYDDQGRVVHQTSDDHQGFDFEYGDSTTTITDPHGLVSVETYSDNLLISTTVGVGTDFEGTTVYAYDDANNLESITDAMGATVRYAYDSDGHKVLAEDALGNALYWHYDVYGNLIEERNQAGVVVAERWYDDRRNLVREEFADGRVVTYDVDPRGLVTRVDGPGAASEQYSYDAAGNRVGVVRSDGSSSTLTYDALGRPTMVTELADRDGDGVRDPAVTTLEYDNKSRLISTVDPVGASTINSYDALGRLVATQDELGYTAQSVYDEFGRVISNTDRRGGATTYTYSPAGRLESTTDPDGGVVALGYDARGLVTSETDALGGVTSYEYDAVGRKIAQTDAEGRTTMWRYDLNGNTTSEIAPDGAVTTWTYNRFGEVATESDPEGRMWSYGYDDLGRLTREVRADGVSRSYTYDQFGVVTSTDWLGRVASVDRDEFGREVRSVDADGRVSTTTYRDGLVATRANPAGVIAEFTYDAAGHVLQTDYSDGSPSVVATYDLAGQVVQFTDGGGVTSYTYDPDRNVIEVEGALGEVQYEYDPTGALVALIYPSGVRVDYVRDLNGKIASAALSSQALLTVERDATGLTERVSFQDGVQSDYGRDLAGRTTSITYTEGVSGVEMFSEVLSRDRAGLVATQDYAREGIATMERALSRDALGRATGVAEDGGESATLVYRASHEVTQDDLGSVTQFSDGGVPMLTNLADGTSIAYEYDELGRRVGSSSSAQADASVFEYDGFDHLTAATVEGARVEYGYSQGLRVSARDVASGTLEPFAWDSLATVPRLLEDGDHTYLYLDSATPVAQVSLADGSIQYLLGDSLGSIRAVVDQAGTVVASMDYSAFGQLQATSDNADATIFGFAGEQRDPTGLVYLRARYLDPVSGQFLTLDPAGPVTGMPYAYTAGDPFGQTDPLGLNPFSDWASGFGSSIADTFLGTLAVLNPFTWDDAIRGARCGAEAAGGGAGGWYAWANQAANPVYALFWATYQTDTAFAEQRYYDAGYGSGNVASAAADIALIALIATVGARSARGAANAVDDALPGVKEGWTSRVADNGNGTVWQAPGSTGNANTLRVMGPDGRYPNGYVRFYNEHGQPIGLDGKPGLRSDTHIPRGPDGWYELPEGW